MNQYFGSVGKVLAKPFQNVSTVFTSSTPPFEFHLDNGDASFVRNALKSLKCNKPARLLKDTSDVIAPINRSLMEYFQGSGRLQKSLHYLKIEMSLKDNYRWISILPTRSKIIEGSAHIPISFFLEEKRLLSQSQFGFRLKRSTSTASIAFTDQVLESMDKGCVTGTVFLDLRKAFDTVDHLLLINKLKSLGVPGKSLEWLCSHLSGRV